MPNNQFVPFATGVGANINDPVAYAALPVRQTGVQPGLASSKLNNNSIRQATFVAAALAQVMVNVTQQDVLDDGDLDAFVTLLTTALQDVGIVKPARIVTASGVFATTLTDYAIGLKRIAGVADSSTTLPVPDDAGQSFKYSDLAANFNAYPLTVNAPVGHDIAGLAAFVANQNRQTVDFIFYGGTSWGVKA